MRPQDRDGGKRLECRHVPGGGHDEIGLQCVVIARPIPDSDPRRTMPDRGVHVEPLRCRVLARDDNVDVVAAAEAVVHHAQEAIRVGRKIHADDFRFLVARVIDETGVLMREAVVVLPPHMAREQIIERGNRSPPRQLPRHFQPFRVLIEHRIDDMRERLIGIEQAVAPGQQIPFQPALALVFAQHLQDTSLRRQPLVVRLDVCHPLPVGGAEDRIQPVRRGFVGAEDPKVLRPFVMRDDIAQEASEHARVFRFDRTRCLDGDAVLAKVWQAQGAQERTAVGVRIRAHPPCAARRQLAQLRPQLSASVEEFLGPIALQPRLEQCAVHGVLSWIAERNLMRTEGALVALSVHRLRPGPSLGRREHDHGPARPRRCAVSPGG